MLALAALHGDELLLLAALERAFVGEDFRFVRLAHEVQVLADGHVGRDAARRGHRLAAQRTRWHLHILLVRGRALVLLVTEVLRAARDSIEKRERESGRERMRKRRRRRDG